MSRTTAASVPGISSVAAFRRRPAYCGRGRRVGRCSVNAGHSPPGFTPIEPVDQGGGRFRRRQRALRHRTAGSGRHRRDRIGSIKARNARGRAAARLHVRIVVAVLGRGDRRLRSSWPSSRRSRSMSGLDRWFGRAHATDHPVLDQRGSGLCFVRMRAISRARRFPWRTTSTAIRQLYSLDPQRFRRTDDRVMAKGRGMLGAVIVKSEGASSRRKSRHRHRTAATRRAEGCACGCRFRPANADPARNNQSRGRDHQSR